jgi:hypothetical protein
MTKPMDHNSNEFLQAIRTSELGAKIAADLDAQRHEARKALVDELNLLNAQTEASFPRLVAEVDKAAAAVRKAEIALRDARDKHARAVGARTSASATFTYRVNELEKQLTDTAHPAIADAKAWALAELQKARKAIATRVSHSENFITGQRRETVESNAAAIRERLSGLNGMLEALNDLSLLAVTDDNAMTAIDQMRSALPKIGD